MFKFDLKIKIPARAVLRVVLRNRGEVLYEGPSRSVSSFNFFGPFDVLPGHINFVSLIKEQVVIRPTVGGERRTGIEGPAVLSVRDNEVKIFLGIAKPPPIPT